MPPRTREGRTRWTVRTTTDVLRLLRWGALGTWVVLAALQYGAVPFFRYGWAFNLWQYLPPPAAIGLAALSLAVCFEVPRSAVLRALEAAAPSTGVRSVTRVLAVGAIAFAAFWLLRERHLTGDSPLILVAAGLGWQFFLPDIGATYLFQLAIGAGRLVGLTAQNAAQILVCAAGAVAVVLLLRFATYLASTPRQQLIVAAYMLCGGLLRVLAGHVEVYAVLVMAAAAYLWAACACLRGRCRWWVPAVALGVALWTHLSAVCLIPSLLLVLRRRPPDGTGRAILRLVAGGALVAAPVVVFLAAEYVTGHHGDLARAYDVAREMAGTKVAANPKRWFVRGWGGEPTTGTDYVAFSWPHLKYLLNAFFVLAPSAALVIAARRGHLLATVEARFLAVVSLPLVAYACAVRPRYGPYDWDLFSLTALCLSALAAHVLFTSVPEPLASHAGGLLVVETLCFVSIPLLAVGLGAARPAGPFAGSVAYGIVQSGGRPLEDIAPWL